MGSNQKGFSAVETVLVGVIISIIGFAGWFVWNSQKQTTKTPNNSNKGSTVVQTNKTTDSSTAQSTTTPVVVKEWNVKFAIPDGIKAVGYEYDTSKAIFPGDVILITSLTDTAGKKYALFNSDDSSAAETQADAICTAYGIGRSTNSKETNVTTGQAYEQVAHIGTYYYYIARASGAMCGQSASASKATEASINMLKKPMAE